MCLCFSSYRWPHACRTILTFVPWRVFCHFEGLPSSCSMLVSLQHLICVPHSRSFRLHEASLKYFDLNFFSSFITRTLDSSALNYDAYCLNHLLIISCVFSTPSSCLWSFESPLKTVQELSGRFLVLTFFDKQETLRKTLDKRYLSL